MSRNNSICKLIVPRLITVLDQVEMRVERLRRDTMRIVEERDSLLSTLDSVKHSELLSDISECELNLKANKLLVEIQLCATKL